MHILMYRWKAYNYRDIEQTFLLLGHTVDNIEQELGSYDVSPEFERVIEEKIRGTHYDMVFTVNYFPLISNVCERTGVKYVSWTCDNPLISMYHESVFHACNYIFTFDKTNYLEFRGMGVKHIWYLPLAVDTERMDALLGAPEKPERRNATQDSEMRKYRGDVAFVGSLYERNSYDKIKNRLPEYLRGYFDAVMEAQLNISGAKYRGADADHEHSRTAAGIFSAGKIRGIFFGSGADFPDDRAWIQDCRDRAEKSAD